MDYVQKRSNHISGHNYQPLWERKCIHILLCITATLTVFFTACRCSSSLSALCLMSVIRLIYCQIALMRLFHGKWRNSPQEFKIFRGCSQLPVGRPRSLSIYRDFVPFLCRHVTLPPLFSNTKPLSKGLILFPFVASTMTFIFTLRLLIERKIK